MKDSSLLFNLSGRLKPLIQKLWQRLKSLLHLILYRFPLKIFPFWITLALYPFFCAYSWSRIIFREMLKLKPAILWAPTPILTIQESSKLLRKLGYPSTTLVYTTYKISSEFDINLKSLINNPIIGPWLPNALFLWALLKFDIFHFFYDGGLWSSSGMKVVPAAKWLELPLLRLAGKRIIASAYGGDVRTRAANEKWYPDQKVDCCMECPEPGKYDICDDATGNINTMYYRDWCNVLLAMGDMHDYVFDSRMDFNYWPIDVKKISYVGVQPHLGPLRIVHAPSSARFFKGTRFVEGAVNSLQAKGYDIQLVMVEGVSNAEAKRMYAEADIIIAQCLIGWIGYTEIEGMAAGKPVIGYIRNPAYLTHSPGCPLISAHADILEQELEKLVKDADLRRVLGQRGREYVERYWSYEALAPHYDRLHSDVWRHNHLLRTLHKKWDDFFIGEMRYQVGKPLQGPQLGEWVIYSDPDRNLRYIKSGVYGQPPFDYAGLPRMFYNGTYVEHPGVVGLYAMNEYHLMLAEPGISDHKTRFLNAATWLHDHLKVDAFGVGRWFYPFEAMGRQMNVPWVSCFSQSIGLSMVLRAEQVAPGNGFLEAAKAAVELFRIPVKDGGVLWEENGQIFLEEYPEPDSAHVLNSWITGIFGLHEYYRVTGEEWTRELFNRCLHTLKQMLPQYVTPKGLRNDLRTDIVVNANYFYFIIQQMYALYQITGDRFFLGYGQRWKKWMYYQKLKSFLSGNDPL